MPPKAPSTRTKKETPSKRSSTQNSSTPKTRAKGRKRVIETTLSEPEDADDATSDAYTEQDDEHDVKSLLSDALDDDSDPGTKKRGGRGSGKRKRVSHGKTPGVKGSSPRKRHKDAASDEDDEGEVYELKEGQQVVGKVVQAPKTGHVPPGQISQNTLNFLLQLTKPECNDREWFRLHEPVFRLAEAEFKLFIENLTELFTEVDPQIPPLPPKDVIYRIYRDVRFSNDKTPYKTSFSATFSRSGRKGIFAGYHIMIKPGGESLLAAGSWCPGKNEIATIRSHILRSPSRLRRIINAPHFVENFGPPNPHSKKGRQNIFGRDDELKTAPKGFDKNHKDIDLLKCRSFVVLHHFTDKQVLDPSFGQLIMEVVKAAKPLVYCMNDYMSVGNDDDDDDPDVEDGDEEEEEEEETDG